jgi:hypothetical protein
LTIVNVPLGLGLVRRADRDGEHLDDLVVLDDRELPVRDAYDDPPDNRLGNYAVSRLCPRARQRSREHQRRHCHQSIRSHLALRVLAEEKSNRSARR